MISPAGNPVNPVIMSENLRSHVAVAPWPPCRVGERE